MSSPEMKLQLRRYSTPTTRSEVIPTIGAPTFTVTEGDAPALQFQISRHLAETLEQPFYVGVEVMKAGAAEWVQPDGDLFVVYEDETEDADEAGIVNFTGVNYVADRLATAYVDTPGMVDGEVEFTNASAGSVMLGLLGQHGSINVAASFTAARDSRDTAWPTNDKATHTFRAQTTVQAALASLVAGNFCSWSTRGTELLLRVAGSGVDRASGRSAFKFGPGAKSVKTRTSTAETATEFLVVSDAPGVPIQKVTRPSLGLGKRQAVVTVTGAADAATALRLAEPFIDAASQPKREVTVIYEAGALPHTPFVDFQLGDLVRVRARGAWEQRRVVGIQLTGGENATVRLTFGDRFLTALAKLSRRAAQLSIAPVSFTGGSGQVVSPAPSVGSPIAPEGLHVESNVGGYVNGRPVAQLTLVWDPVVQTEEGAVTRVTAYEVWGRDDATQSPVMLGTSSTPAATFTLAPGQQKLLAVRASNGRWGALSAELPVVGAAPVAVSTPLAPPDLDSRAGIVVVSHDGSLQGSGAATALDGFQAFSVQYKVGDGPLLQYALRASVAGQLAVLRVPVGETVQVRVAWVDTMGRTSEWSSFASVVSAPTNADDLDIPGIWQSEAWIDYLSAGVISVDMLEPNVGESINISANRGLTIIAGQAAEAVERVQSAEDTLEGALVEINVAKTAADDAASAASFASEAAAAAAAEAAAVREALGELQMVYTFDENGARIAASGSPYSVRITNENLAIEHNGVPVSWWDEGQLIVEAFRGMDVELANHTIQTNGARTVVRAR